MKNKQKRKPSNKKQAKKPAKRVPGSKRMPFVVNPRFEFYIELRDLILKSSPAQRDKMVENVTRLGRVRLAVAAGILINKNQTAANAADLLIVGEDIDRRKLRTFLSALEAEVGKEIIFAIMDKEEFNYRMAMFDRFVRVIMEGPHDKLVNRMGL